MKIEVRIEIDDTVCEAEVVDPHGNTSLVTGETIDELAEKLGEELLSIHITCLVVEQDTDLQLIDLDAVVAFVQMQGFFAYVEQTGGGCATIFAGPAETNGLVPSPGRQRGEPGTEDSRYAAVAGPGVFLGRNWTKGRGHRGDFYIGADDQGEGATTTITDESDERIAELIVAVIKEQP